jgi:hypothetical protein
MKDRLPDVMEQPGQVIHTSGPGNAATAGSNGEAPQARELNWRTYLGIVIVSSVYFADIGLRASQKCLWFDELITWYLCRVPSMWAAWTAVLHGADFNPPLLYFSTHLVRSIFGEGLVATRLPSMLGVWVFGLCLFFFVARRSGPVCGAIAGMLPFFTLAQYYAYEARAHGIVLGWCGLALITWQKLVTGRNQRMWLLGFAISCVGALLTHIYAVYLLVPFALVELYNLLARKRVNLGVIITLAVALLAVALFVYVPLFHMYKARPYPCCFSSHPMTFCSALLSPPSDRLSAF